MLARYGLHTEAKRCAGRNPGTIRNSSLSRAVHGGAVSSARATSGSTRTRFSLDSLGRPAETVAAQTESRGCAPGARQRWRAKRADVAHHSRRRSGPRVGRHRGWPGRGPGGGARRGEASVPGKRVLRSEEHTSELQSRVDLVCRLLLEKKKTIEQRSAPESPDRSICSPRPG